MKKIFIYAGLALALTACSTPRDLNSPLEEWTNFKHISLEKQPLGENQSLVVFYRKNDIQGPAVNVYVNGDYQASLLPNTYSSAAVCSNKNLFTSSFTTTTSFGNRTQGEHYTLPLNEVVYIKVNQNSNGQLSFVRVEKAIAEQEVVQLLKQNQTLSRVIARNCGQGVLANIELNAATLFAFNKSAYQDMLLQGKKEIADFVANISSFPNVTKLVVSGHTDPEGSESYNQVLSQKRAETVKTALQKAGISLPIEAVGYGKSQLVVSHCGNLKGKAKQECNQPNRRVEITIYGNK